MILSPTNLAIIVAVLAVCQPQASYTQFFQPQNGPFLGSLSKASSTASERQLQLGGLGLSRGVVNSQSVTNNNGGFRNGGTTSLANSRSRTGELHLGGLELGSTLTASKTRTNGAVSRSLSHDLNVGKLGVGTSFSRVNLRNGVGLQRSASGGVQLGLGLINVDLSRNQHQQQSQTATQAQAQAQGVDAFASSNSDANSRSRHFGGLGFTKTQSQSNAISGTSLGQTSAQAGGSAGDAASNVNSFGFRRAKRSIESKNEASSDLNENNGFSDANSNAGSLSDLVGFEANSGALSDLNEVQSFVGAELGFEAFKKSKRKSSSFYTQLQPQKQNQTSSTTLEIINDSKEINWPKKRIQGYNHYPQKQQQPQLPQQREQQQPQQKHIQQLHYSSINPNSSTEQFAVIDENERHGRTFTLITDLIKRFTQPTCVYPCTLEAYQQQRCCETAVVVPQPPPNVCCQQPELLPPSVLRPSTTIVRPASVLPPSSLQPLPTISFPLIPTQCCNSCPAFVYYGPPPCIRYTFPVGSPGRFTFYMG